MKHRITLREISELTGLSTFSVSQALNGGKGVSNKTREQVIQVAERVGYVPNQAAQELRLSSRSSIAVITAGTSNVYYLDMVNGIQHVIQKTDNSVVLMDIAVNGIYDEDLEDRTIQRLLEARVSGVISTLALKLKSIERLERWGIPIVFVDSLPPVEKSYLPSVTTDNYNASLLVGEHLAEHGYKDWLFLVYPDIWSSSKDRKRGLCEAAQQANANIQIIESPNDAQSAEKVLTMFLEERGDMAPDALITGNSPILLGALSCLKKLKISIPNDIAIISYDDFPWASFIEPALTVLDERSEEVGCRAAEILMQIIDEKKQILKVGESSIPQYSKDLIQQVSVDLIVRQSCGCKPKT
ncbi:MAG: LacI family DNA-binding transcriptional regulator [Dysgonomonas sp.]